MIKKKTLTFLLCLALGLFGTHAQNLEIRGNGQLIPSDGSNIPGLSDGTDFGNLNIGEESGNAFRLTSLETERRDIMIVSISVDSPHFYYDGRRILILRPEQSRVFDIVYAPQSGGLHEATVQVTAIRGRERIAYSFNVKGFSTAEVMISQSLENGDSDILEIANLSESTISDGDYVIGVFNRRRDLRQGPSQVFDVGEIPAGETVTIGPDDLFDGDEVLVLSTSSGNRCYEDRVDELGVHRIDWGSNRSLTKGACSSETAHLDFDSSQWTTLSLDEANTANSRQNISLGRYDPQPLVWDGSSWSNGGYPDKTRSLILNGDYQGELSDLESCHLEVNAKLDYNHGSTHSVVVYGNLTVSGEFLLGDEESLVMFDPEAQISGEIMKIERSTFRNNKHDFTYWTSPVGSAQIDEVFSGVNPGRIYFFDQSQTSSSDPSDPDYWSTWRTGSGDMIPALGYAAEGEIGTTGIHEIQFAGVPNNGDVRVRVQHWEDQDPDNDWNLLGNPYPSAIDIEKFFDENAGLLEPVIYLWTHSTPVSNGGDYAFDDYATYNYTGGTGIGSGVGDGPIPQKNIGSAQGFFIRSLAEGDAIFTNEMRLIGENDQFFKPERRKDNHRVENEKDRIWLNLTNDQGGFNQLLLGFFDQASPDFDPGYDARRFEGGNPISFYTRLKEDKLVIQARESFDSGISIPLGFTSQVAPRKFSIEIAKIEGKLRNEKILLRDMLLGVVHDLSSGPYEFSVLEAGEQPDRFQLEFREERVFDIQEVKKESNWVAFAQYERCYVQSSETVRQIRVYNLLGALIHESFPNESRFDIPLQGVRKGEILLIDVFDELGGKRSKKIYNSSPHL